jgi:hypothetical protein
MFVGLIFHVTHKRKKRERKLFFSNAMPLRSDPLHDRESLPPMRLFSEEKIFMGSEKKQFVKNLN